MDIGEFLSQADRILNNAGDSCDFGCSENAVSEMIEYIKTNLPEYPYCIISDWTWIDINVSKEALEQIDKRGLKPCAIYANKVIEDEAGRPFESVRTTLLQGFHKNCIFLSRNTAYILLRPETRITVEYPVFASIFS